MTTTTDQEINFSNYFSSVNNSSTELENKKKKASRACLHCQRAHLTCDDSRPCQRCVKRDLATTCTDAARKRAKYLQDLPVEETIFNNNTEPSSSSFSDSILNTTTSSMASTTQSSLLYPNNQQLFDFSLTDLGFGSETVGLEYGFLGNMLQNPLEEESGSTTVTTSAATPIHLSMMQQQQQNNNNNMQQQLMQQQQQQMAFQPFYSSPFVQQQSSSSPVTSTPVTKRVSSPHSESSSITTMMPLNSPFTNSLKRNAPFTGRRKGYGNTPEEAYASVKKPFNYAEGFHYLIQYVRDRMGRDNLMRISRAMALFRPSLLALIMNLTEEDLVFMEKCVQRTLLEYEKLISFSGTPTVVWRRTGEVCLVGKEFSLLTQWTKDMLLGKKIYIYELMDSQSVVEYWENFSMYAFDNTNKSCVYSCIIKTPQQKPVPCTFCFTIKRDIFDLPSVIVGNFLPILS
ncbi:hypothetical protein EDC94DRAFT_626592 [Helicostylum pulchrum]|uniref:Zn(2)-C6 fungal-type domain-containing protein n=1 Tax=Helicostylum pulchrum TaxID=562976 RepID=A0ABP9YF72_9FUNG|nr:hypothetical protein EDC94DRAFT_626592 [Helicostylum pulchrum]